VGVGQALLPPLQDLAGLQFADGGDILIFILADAPRFVAIIPVTPRQQREGYQDENNPSTVVEVGLRGAVGHLFQSVARSSQLQGKRDLEFGRTKSLDLSAMARETGWSFRTLLECFYDHAGRAASKKRGNSMLHAVGGAPNRRRPHLGLIDAHLAGV
jgi:cytochrome oxidase assembly protein ShyY1